MSNRVRFASPVLLLMAAALCGCHSAPPVAPAPPPIVSTPSVHETAPVPPPPSAQVPVKDLMVAVMADMNAIPFPKGTQLIGFDLKDGVAVLDFSKEFNALANAGDSTESQVQKGLCATLAKFPEVQKMKVTVEGKPFDSQNTDWTTPFPVRSGATDGGRGGKGGGQ